MTDFAGLRDPVLVVPCPNYSCRAQVGVWCKRPSGHKAMTAHSERRDAADIAWLEAGAPFLDSSSGRVVIREPKNAAERRFHREEIAAVRATFSTPEGDESMSKKKAVKKASKKSAPKKPAVLTSTYTRADGAKTVTGIGGTVPGQAILLAHGQLYRSPLNPRTVRDKDEDQALLESIKQHGVQVPLMARPRGGRWEIIMGNRRHEAVGVAIKDGALPKTYELRVIERDCTDDELIELAGVENMGRKDMHPLDEANLIQHMRKVYKRDADGIALDHLVAQRLGIKERTLYRRVALLRLATPLQEDLRTGKITLQDAVAFSLGTEKQQLELREQMKKADKARLAHLYSPAQIRDAMTGKRIPVANALFALSEYSGQIIDDPDTGASFFGNASMFRDLQDKAVRKKVKELKARYAWVKDVENQEGTYNFEPAGPRDKKAGAIWYLTKQGQFLVQAPVTEVDDEADTSSVERGLRSRLNERRAENDAKDKAAEKELEQIIKVLEDDRQRALVLLLIKYIDDNMYMFGDREPKLLLPFLGKMWNGKVPEEFSVACHQYGDGKNGNTEEGWQVAAFRLLLERKHDELIGLLIALSIGETASEISTGGRDIKPLGMVVLQRDLPLAAE